MNKSKLKQIAKQLVHPDKGILAADESASTIEKRLDSVGVKSTEKNRRDYRELLFSTPGVEDYISGVILYEETFKQESSKGIKLTKILSDKGILTGIKVDQKAHDMALCPGEKITEGLDGLRERLAEYRSLGASFTKWRAVITIGKNIPSQACLLANAHALGRYAALAQEVELVPIVEPEVLMDGSHTIDRCAQVTQTTLQLVFEQLNLMGVYLPGILLKPNMVIAGADAKKSPGVETVARQTLEVFDVAIPKQVPGVAFLSGGQSPELACQHLNQINKLSESPWELSYSFGRALQQEALQAWSGKKANWTKAQEVFLHRAQQCSLARRGEL